jgi:hypothetical protein
MICQGLNKSQFGFIDNSIFYNCWVAKSVECGFGQVRPLMRPDNIHYFLVVFFLGVAFFSLAGPHFLQGIRFSWFEGFYLRSFYDRIGDLSRESGKRFICGARFRKKPTVISGRGGSRTALIISYPVGLRSPRLQTYFILIISSIVRGTRPRVPALCQSRCRPGGLPPTKKTAVVDICRAQIRQVETFTVSTF